MFNEKEFLAEIQANPSDDSARAIYADWLEDQGDRRAEYFRLVATMTQMARGDDEIGMIRRLDMICQSIDRGWREAVGKRFDVLLEKVGSNRKFITVIAIRYSVGLNLTEMKELVGAPPGVLLRQVLREDAEVLRNFVENFANESPSYPPAKRLPVPEGGSNCTVCIHATQ